MPSRVIAEQDLVPVNAEREAFIETRAQEVDLPARFTVVYQDLERDADIGTQYAKRVAGRAAPCTSRSADRAMGAGPVAAPVAGGRRRE